MKARGNFDAVQNLDPLQILLDETRHHIDHWVAKFPPERKRSALIQALWRHGNKTMDGCRIS